MQNPNASQWNIGCVGFETQNYCVGHVHFMLFVSISFALGSQRKRSFQWNMGLRILAGATEIIVWPVENWKNSYVINKYLKHTAIQTSKQHSLITAGYTKVQFLKNVIGNSIRRTSVMLKMDSI